MISNAIEAFAGYSVATKEAADDFRKESISQGGTWGPALTARALYIAQAVISLVAAPLSLLGLLFGSGVVLCTEGREKACEVLKGAILMPLLHIAIIPTVLIATVLPHSLKWDTPAAQALECLKA